MQELEKFFDTQHSLQEMSLYINVSQNTESIIGIMHDRGYKPVTTKENVSGTGNQYIIISPDTIEWVYVLAAQYSSGAWVSLTNIPIIPDYNNLSIIGIIDKPYLEELQNQGRDLLSKVGMTIQL